MKKYNIVLRRTKYDTAIEETYVVKKQRSFLKIFKWWICVPSSDYSGLGTFDSREKAEEWIKKIRQATREWKKIKNKRR